MVELHQRTAIGENSCKAGHQESSQSGINQGQDNISQLLEHIGHTVNFGTFKHFRADAAHCGRIHQKACRERKPNRIEQCSTKGIFLAVQKVDPLALIDAKYLAQFRKRSVGTDEIHEYQRDH